MPVVVSSRPNDFQQAHACTAPKRKRTLLYDLRVHNIDRLRYHVAMHNWSDHLQCTDVQSVYDLFLRDVSMLILCNIPTKFVTVGPRDPSYVTPLVRSLLNKRRRLRKRRRFDEANILAGKINLLIQQARSKELSKLNQATPKELWASVKNTTTNSTGVDKGGPAPPLNGRAKKFFC